MASRCFVLRCTVMWLSVLRLGAVALQSLGRVWAQIGMLVDSGPKGGLFGDGP